ncbi:MAG: hypothetical protein IPK82_01945 [Polyangiaceae bacterium]|nr:hypothetical protein [Polyangiaceae bacterium]
MRARFLAFALAFAINIEPAKADNAEPAEGPVNDAALFEKGGVALSKGEYGAAIDSLEALADRGFLHPDASYNRGLAYVMRIRSGAAKPGDFGRAAAAFEECLLLSPNDTSAEAALDAVRGEVTRRRSKKGGSTMDARPTLDRAIAALMSERAWTIASIITSIVLAIGIFFRRIDDNKLDKIAEKQGETIKEDSPEKPAQIKGPAHPIHVAGTVMVAVSVVLLCFLVPFAWHARTLKATTKPGVIVVNEAYLTDDTGRAKGGDPVPEAASVEVGERRGVITHIRWGAAEGWVPSTSVRVLP